MDDLTKIEKAYGSVTEYNRSKEEDSDMAFESQQQAQDAFVVNEEAVQRYKSDGYVPLYEAFNDVEQCGSCKTRTKIFILNEYDDTGLFFCLNKDCEHYKSLIK